VLRAALLENESVYQLLGMLSISPNLLLPVGDLM